MVKSSATSTEPPRRSSRISANDSKRKPEPLPPSTTTATTVKKSKQEKSNQEKSKPEKAKQEKPAATKKSSRKEDDDENVAKDDVAKEVVDGDDKPKSAKPAATPKSTTGSLKQGDQVPSITLQDQDEKKIDIGSLKNVVLFSYPKANTSGCTKQAQCYRDDAEKWSNAGYQIFGLSNDGPTALKNWKDKQNFPYSLISDPQRQLIEKLTGSKDKTKRSHFIIDGDGKLALIATSVKPPDSSSQALEFVKSLK